MIRFIDYLKNILSKKTSTVFIVLLAIAGRIIQLLYFFNIRRDTAYQVIATKNFVAGYGVSMAKVVPEDLSATVYDPLINWPPGYSLLLSPFYVLFNGNYIAAGLTVSILFAIILIFVSRSILRTLDLPLYLVNSYTLVAGFFTYFFYFIPSSDAIAICLAIIGVYYCLSLIKSPGKWFWRMVSMTVCLILCGAIKYLFIPVVFVIPFFLAWKGVSEKQIQLKKIGLLSFSAITIVLGTLLLWQKYVGGSAAYIHAPGRGFFPEHLLDAYPFIPSALIKPDTAALLLPSSFESLVYSIFQWIHIAFLAIATFFIAKKILNRGIKGLSLAGSFFYLTLFLSLTITLLLAVLSLAVEKETFSATRLWTYIQEARYYGLSTVLIQLVAFVYYKENRNSFSRIKKYGFYLLFLLLFAEMFRGIVFDARKISDFGKREYSWQSDYKLQQYADSIIENARKKRSFEKVIVAGSTFYMNLRVGVYSDVILAKESITIEELSSFATKKPVLLLIIINEKDIPVYEAYLAARGKELAGQFNGLYFYTVYVNPN